MNKPTLTKTDNAYSIFTFDRGRTFDSGQEYVPNQLKSTSGSGYEQVITISKTRRYIDARFRHISKENYENFVGFMEDETVDWQANSFTFNDEWGVSYEVYLVLDSLYISMNKNYTYNIEFKMRVV